MKFVEKLRAVGLGLGCLLQVVIWGGGILIHLMAAIIIYYKHGILLGVISFGFPVVSTVYAIFITIFSGLWLYTGLVAAYIITFIVSWFLIGQAEEL